MEPKFLQKSTKSAEHSFFCKYAEVPHTFDEFHYHKEFELLYTIENHGSRFIGDSIDSFSNNDLVLVGPGLPHCWQSNREYYNADSGLHAKVILIHFEKDFLGEDFFEIPEMKLVRKMLSKANRGLHFAANDAYRYREILFNIVEKQQWAQILDLLALLGKLSECEYTQLASESFSNSYHQSSSEDRITGIYNFLIQNHYKDLTLQDIADYANMNMSAFCRYFKKATSSTFSDTLNIIRVGVACKKLINTELSIAEIGYACGYQSISYFNRQFKKVKQISPSAYRMRYLNNGNLVKS